MKEFVKKVLSKMWPFSLFMNRIQELHEKNRAFLDQINKNQNTMLEQDQKLESLQKKLEVALLARKSIDQ